MARIHGSKGQIKLDPTGGATGVAVGSVNEWTLDQTRDSVEVTCFGDTEKQFVMGLRNNQGTLAGYWDSAASEVLFDVAAGDVAATLTLIPSSVEPTFLWKGLAYLDVSVNCPATGAVTISGNWVGSGPWVREPIV
jgi:hypothetical protein